MLTYLLKGEHGTSQPEWMCRDTLVVATGDMLTSVFGGFVTFAIIGYMASELQLPIHKVATHGNFADFDSIIIYSTLFTTEVANNTKIHIENIQ